MASNNKNRPRKSTPTKQKYKSMILEYLGNIDNDPPTRDELADKALKISRTTLYNHFSPGELAELEADGLAIRRARYAGKSAAIDSALVARALKGDVRAIRLYYERIEGWSPKSTLAIEQNLDDLRKYAQDNGYDPEEFVAMFLKLKNDGALPE